MVSLSFEMSNPRSNRSSQKPNPHLLLPVGLHLREDPVDVELHPRLRLQQVRRPQVRDVRWHLVRRRRRRRGGRGRPGRGGGVGGGLGLGAAAVAVVVVVAVGGDEGGELVAHDVAEVLQAVVLGHGGDTGELEEKGKVKVEETSEERTATVTVCMCGCFSGVYISFRFGKNVNYCTFSKFWHIL